MTTLFSKENFLLGASIASITCLLFSNLFTNARRTSLATPKAPSISAQKKFDRKFVRVIMDMKDTIDMADEAERLGLGISGTDDVRESFAAYLEDIDSMRCVDITWVWPSPWRTRTPHEEDHDSGIEED